MPPIPPSVLFGSDAYGADVDKINIIKSLLTYISDPAKHYKLYEFLYYMRYDLFTQFVDIFPKLSESDRKKLIDNIGGRNESVDLDNYTFSYLFRTFTPKAAMPAMSREVAGLMPTPGYNPNALGYREAMEEIKKVFPLPPLSGGRRKTRNRNRNRKRKTRNRRR